MDGILASVIFFVVLLLLLFVIILLFSGKSYLRRMYMVDDIVKQGGIVSYQGSSFKVMPGATAEVHMSYVIFRNPNGTSAKFSAGRAFSPMPVIQIGLQE